MASVFTARRPFAGMFRVVVPVDANEARARAAAETVVSIPNSTESVHATVVNVEERVRVKDDAIVDSEEWFNEENNPPSVDAAVAVLEGAGVDCETRREHDDPVTAIIAVATDVGADRIVMGGRNRSPAGKVLFGSVTQSVLLHSPIPVTVTMGTD